MKTSKAAIADDEFDPRVSLAWESLLVQRDYDLLWSLKRSKPEKLRGGDLKNWRRWWANRELLAI